MNMSQGLLTGEDIRRLRKRSKLTQKQLAEKSRVSQSLITRIETGDVDPRLSTLSRIFNALTRVESAKTAAEIMHSPVITTSVKDTVGHTVEVMKKHGISQMPVMDGNNIVGSIQESTLMRTIMMNRESEKIFNTELGEVMEESFPTIGLTTPLDEIMALLTRDEPAILVTDQGSIAGIITKIDVISSMGTSAGSFSRQHP